MTVQDSTAIAPGAISPAELVIHLTLRCPLRCEHCCFRSDIYRSDRHLDLPSVLSAIDQAADLGTMERVSFVGGDPFLHPDILRAAATRARERNLQCAVVTSAFWAKTLDRARTLLRPLVEAGLTRITYSYDDSHAAHVPEQQILNGVDAALELNLPIMIAVTTEPGCRIDGAYMRRLLGDRMDERKIRVYETAVASTGRALDESTEERRAARRENPNVYRGPCKSAFRNISLLSNGDIVGCCGVLPTVGPSTIGNVAEDRLADAVSRAYRDDLLKWIAFEGPIAILEQITANTEHPRTADEFDGICEPCSLLFTPEYRELVERALPEKLPSLRVQQLVYEAVGAYIEP